MRKTSKVKLFWNERNKREKQKAILFAFYKEQQLKEHKASHDVLIILLEGECNFVLDGATHVLRAGQVFCVPANVPHALTAITNFKMILLR